MPVEPPRNAPGRARESDAAAEPRRRRVRKGTRSCWECRRRKMKCIFDSATDGSCVRCQRRGAKCISQELPEKISTSLDRSLLLSDRMARVEALVDQLAENVENVPEPARGCATGKGDEKQGQGIPTLGSPGSRSSRNQASWQPLPDTEATDFGTLDASDGVHRSRVSTSRPAGPGKHQRLSRLLCESLPSPEDSQLMSTARGGISTLFHRMLTVPYNGLAQSEPDFSENLLKRPEPHLHPVLMARHMLHLATFLQHLHPDFQKEIAGLSEPPREMMKRLADAAISLVTSNDDLVGSIEGLECVILECLYHTNVGNLRKALIVIRRAMIIAQLMGFHQPGSRSQCKVLDHETEAHPHFVWFRIVCTERHLCLMLGLPQGTPDHSMASDAMLAGDTPMGRLERIHCVVTSRILERNQSSLSSDDEYTLTHELDRELQRAASDLPSQWWLAANLAAAVSNPDALFWEMRRLFHQLFHYYLLTQLHLPHMLRPSATGHKYDYSRLTCVNAAREVLSRYIAFQNFSRMSFCCRTVDFFSLVSAMTLLMAYLDGHRRCAASLAHSQIGMQQTTHVEDMLAHRRLADCAMVERARESMEESSRLDADALSAQSADLLRRLLAIEAEAARGNAHHADSVSVLAWNAGGQPVDEIGEHSSGAVRVHIPYFGTINIAREGVISKEALDPQPGVASISQRQAGLARIAAGVDGLHAQSPGAYAHGATLYPKGILLTEEEYGCNVGQPADAGTRIREFSHQLVAGVVGQEDVQSSRAISSAPLQQYEDPVLTAGIDDWAFQGVDLAFFDNLMRGAACEGDEDY